MTSLNEIPQSWRILFLGVVFPGALAICGGYLYLSESRTKTIDASINQAKSLCQSADATRNQYEKHWDDGIFSREDLIKWSETGEAEKIFAAVPVSAAMTAIRSSADSAEYEFRVPAFKPRNPENKPTPFESAALQELAASGLDEISKINTEHNTVHYFRRVDLSDTCLMCHGHPSTSSELWGNDKGLDVAGYPMENWKAGEMYGAFEIIQSLDSADEQAASTVAWAGLAVLVTLVGGGVASVLVARSIRRDQAGKARAIGDEVSQQLSEDTQHITSAVQELSSNASNIAENADSAAQTARGIVERVRATNSHGEMLDQKSKEIGNIVQLIDTIAEQTNLLALNATIEAARAGEAGKGFAVVAGEVKSLAQQTSEATQTITNGVESIQETSFGLLGELRDMQEVIDTIDSAQDQIAEAVSQQRIATDEISRSFHGVVASTRSLGRRLSQENSVATVPKLDVTETDSDMGSSNWS